MRQEFIAIVRKTGWCAARTVTANVLANLVNAGDVDRRCRDLRSRSSCTTSASTGFGVWTLAQTALIYTATAETGFGPAVQRFVSVAHGAGDRVGAARVVWSASGFYVALGVAVAVLTALLAAPIVSLFDVPPALHDDAVAMFRITGVAMLLALAAAGLAERAAGRGALRGRRRGDGHLGGRLSRRAPSRCWPTGAASGLAEAALAAVRGRRVVRAWMVRDVLLAAPFARVSQTRGARAGRLLAGCRSACSRRW